MRLLVTRPQPDADQTAERLRTLGHDVLVEPLLHTELLPLERSIDPRAIILTSRNGVRALSAWPQSERWRDRPVFAVGPSTAEAATSRGFTNTSFAGGDATSLATFVSNGLSPALGSILYPAARDRSVVLENALKAGGYELETIVAYRMMATGTLPKGMEEAVSAGRIDGALLYSRRSAETFVSLIDKAGLAAALSRLQMFVISDAVAKVFEGRTVRGIEVAGSPHEDALLSLLPKAR